MVPPYTSIMMSGLGSIGQSGADESLIAEDGFTAPNGTKFLDHKPGKGGPVWFPTIVVATGPDNSDHGSIQNNKLTILINNFGAMMHANTSEQHVEVDWTPSADPNCRNSIVLRNGGTHGSGYMMNFRRDNQDVNIFRVTGSTTAALANGAVTFNAGQTYRIKAIASGTSLEIYVDDVLKASATDSTYQTNEFVGLMRNTGNSTSTFDNFMVRDASGPKTPFVPTDVPNCWSWIDVGDYGSTPGTWEDRSGNGRHWVPGTSPTFNPGETVWDGATMSLNGPDMTGITGANTFFMYLKNNPNKSASGSDTGLAYLGDHVLNDLYPYNGNYYIGFGINDRPNIGPLTGFDFNEYHNLTTRYSALAGTNYYVRTHRVDQWASQQSPGCRANPRIGLSYWNAYFYGWMKGFIVYNRNLSTAEIYKIETYLAGL